MAMQGTARVAEPMNPWHVTRGRHASVSFELRMRRSVLTSLSVTRCCACASGGWRSLVSVCSKVDCALGLTARWLTFELATQVYNYLA